MTSAAEHQSIAFVEAREGDREALNAFFPSWYQMDFDHMGWLAIQDREGPQVVGAAVVSTREPSRHESGLRMDVAAIDQDMFEITLEGLLERVIDESIRWGATSLSLSEKSHASRYQDLMKAHDFKVIDTFDLNEIPLLPGLQRLETTLARLEGRVASRSDWSIREMRNGDARVVSECWSMWIGSAQPVKQLALSVRLPEESNDELISLLAIDGDLVVGFIVGDMVSEDTCEIRGQAVAPAMRMDPLHASLTLECLRRAQARGATKIRFEAGRNQPNTRRVAERYVTKVLASHPVMQRSLVT